MADLVFPGKVPNSTLNSDAMPSNYDLVIYKGDYVELFVTLKDSVGAAINLTGYTARAQLKETYEDNAPISFTCTTTGTLGEVRIYLSSALSTTLKVGSYIWDFEIVNSNNDSRTYLTGDVTVFNQITTS